ncbi:uncharacterized protein [Argopecten irradians]|uniref:uncharacterized protein n=1 Tax=Argopecten irradians TaxID=31199 RepID=UPI003721CC94
MENEAKGLDANCTSPSVVLDVSRDACLQACAESTTCEALTVKSVRLCSLFNCTTSIQTDFTHLFFIYECSESWMFGFSHRKGVIFTPVCYYDDRGLCTRGSCSDDVIDDVHQNSTLAECQTICDSSEYCQGITFQEDQHVCRLHVCSDKYIFVNDSLSSFYTKRCESSNQFGTVGTRTRATCPDWESNNFFQVWTHLDCQIACLRQIGCNGVTVQPTRQWTCSLQACNESIYFDDPDFSFYSKNHTGTGFMAHGQNKIGRCGYLSNAYSLKLDVDECADACLNTAECQGFIIQQQRLYCKFHSCKSYMNMTGYYHSTFYWRIGDSTAASESNSSFIEPDLPTEAPLLEKHRVEKNVKCDFQPTTNLSEICNSINDDSVIVSNESDCFHLCEMKEDCSGVTMRSVGITCYLQYCGESEYTTNVYLRFLSKQVTRNCSYTPKGPATNYDCAFISSATSSLEQCQDTCTHQPDCRGIRYDTSTMLCRPSICPQYQYRQYNSDSVSFYTNACEDVLYYVNHGHHSVGTCGSFDTIQVQTENECQLLCTNNPHCQGVTLNEPRYECQQYNCQTASPSVYTNGSSYLKVCDTNSDDIVGNGQDGSFHSIIMDGKNDCDLATGSLNNLLCRKL